VPGADRPAAVAAALRRALRGATARRSARPNSAGGDAPARGSEAL
jgi:hypothetical protein